MIVVTLLLELSPKREDEWAFARGSALYPDLRAGVMILTMKFMKFVPSFCCCCCRREEEETEYLLTIAALREELEQTSKELLQSCEAVNTLRRREKELTDR